MNAHAFAASGYGQAGLGLKMPRAQEYEVIARITARIKSAQDSMPIGFPALVAALNENRRLWTELATDVSLPANSLPMTMKVLILNLAQFTLQQTSRILDGTGSVDPLIDINLAIMKGLSGKGGDE